MPADNSMKAVSQLKFLSLDDKINQHKLTKDTKISLEASVGESYKRRWDTERPHEDTHMEAELRVMRLPVQK